MDEGSEKQIRRASIWDYDIPLPSPDKMQAVSYNIRMVDGFNYMTTIPCPKSLVLDIFQDSKYFIFQGKYWVFHYINTDLSSNL